MVRVKTRRITRKENLLRPLNHEIALSLFKSADRYDLEDFVQLIEIVSGMKGIR